MANKKITSRDVDFAKWYTDVVTAARLSSYSNVKGCIILEPNGYAIWEMIQKTLDKMFKETGHRNVAMPMLIPENLMNKESELINGFAPEVAWVTMGGSKNLEERMCIRPTSETLFSDYYASVVNSYRDLPLKYNQWCSVMRWEKETRPFLRSREFWWQEGHTVHETKEEAEQETRDMLNVYKKFFWEYLAIPAITGRKTDKEKFAGAEYTLTIESLMYNGVSLQSGTSHYFGQKFSKAYDIKFLNRNNELENAYQTSWGVSSRMIGALIMVHSDDDGLVLPPKIAPVQARIIPIGDSSEVWDVTDDIYKKLNAANIAVEIDKTEKSPGFKFAEAEVLGIPVRIEVGARDLERGVITLVRRDTKEKIEVAAEADIVTIVNDLMQVMQNDMLKRAKDRRDNMTYEARSLSEFENIMNNTPGFIKADWCGDENCELRIKEIRGTKSRCIMEGEKPLTGKCVVCGKDADKLVTWGIQY
ncbi:MAG: proline--tRNA ligase [Bacilli bacterium]|nr:proline--tRNA ligase [Bacilli bacterium]